MKENKWSGLLVTFLRENFLPIGLFVAVVGMMLYGLNSAKAGSSQEELRMVEESITRSVVSCYAIEGRYPESLDYLVEHYNLQINPEKYHVQYQIFASNIMPDVTVLEVSP